MQGVKTSRHFGNNKREYLKGEINELENKKQGKEY
jgi:hypothetical protein